ncbi:D-alanyl-D-alanine dipeptidase/carboxypeptidase [Paenibacillaceae bacterium GAS479]|nr:D-alanyl-D-alanine dipeptidase/carboxypeptidase [Paenibacillaceae bacterium GAS479]
MGHNQAQSQGHELKRTEVRLNREEIYKGHLVLINQIHPVEQPLHSEQLRPLNTHPAIKEWRKGMLLERECLQHFAALLEASQGMNEIIAVSGYRTKQEQVGIYEGSLVENGPQYTARYVALPDHSEHQIGLAIDVGVMNDEVDFIAPAFPDSGAAKRFKELAAEYGFIQRYQEEKESITGISCEPWHFRYVGYPHAKIMEDRQLCLEEYIEFLQGYTFSGEHLEFTNKSTEINIYYVPAEENDTMIPILECDDYRISGTNGNGFIVTAFVRAQVKVADAQ